MTIITAFTESFRPVGELCIASIKRHHKGRYAHEIIPDDFLPDYTLGASWWKILMIRRYLDFGPVVWVDSDTIMLQPLPDFTPEAYLSLCEDCNGVNFGVMVWRPCADTSEILEAVWDGRQYHKDSKWAEQSAFHDLDAPPVSILPKQIWNAYEGEVTNETVFAHFPGMGMEERLEKMTKLIA